MAVLNLDGFTDVPEGKIAAVVTWLEMTEAPGWRVPQPTGVSLALVGEPEPGWYRALFREIGENWLWFSRLRLSDRALHDLFGEPQRFVHAARREGRDIGLLELNFADPAAVEIAFFGLVPDAVGNGLGRWLMGQALQLCWGRPGTERVWLHTCTLDHPNALSFYMKCGFRPYRRAVEVTDDPRLIGHIAPEAGRHHPVIAPRGAR